MVKPAAQDGAIAARHRRSLLLSTSLTSTCFIVLAALTIGADPAFACAVDESGSAASIDNASAIDCIVIESSATISGNVTNSNGGTITPPGVLGVTPSSTGILINGTIGGAVVNQGSITAANGDGILVEFGGAVSGGISNAGTISAEKGTSTQSAGYGIFVTGGPGFSGGISNSGMISSEQTGIAAGDMASFTGGITNSGTITGGNVYGIFAFGSSATAGTFTGGISNSGVISTGASGAGMAANNITSFTGGIANSGMISGGGNGINVTKTTGIFTGTASFSGGITNSGTISVTGSGIVADNIDTFSGGISNSGNISAGSPGISVFGVGTFSGGIGNSGTITAGSDGMVATSITNFGGGVTNSGNISVAGTAINVWDITNFTGGITNSGNISALRAGIVVAYTNPGASSFSGGITNSGMISSGSHNGIYVGGVSDFAGGITNSGVIAATQIGIQAVSVASFSGNIANSGTISAATGIVINSGVTFAPDSVIINSGTITGTIAAIDASAATSPVTIDQVAGLISGDIKLSANADVLNMTGGTIAGNIVGAGTSDTVNFDIGADNTFTYGSAFGFSGIDQVNVDSGTIVLDGTNSATNTAVNSGATLAVNGTLASSVAVNADAVLEGTGFVGATTNSGIVAPGFAGAMGTLTVQGDYAGTGGHLAITAALGGDDSPTSRLVVDGATSGTTQVDVTNRGGLGGRTVEGIEIVEVAGASNGDFVLDGDYVFHGTPLVVGGAYSYGLYQGSVSDPTDGNWYLRNALLDPDDPSSPLLFQPGVAVYEAYGANLLALNTLPTLQQRVGNRSWMAGSNPEGTGIWGRVEGSDSRVDPRQSATDETQDTDIWKVQFGADRVVFDGAQGQRLVAGITASYGKANTTIHSAIGNGAIKTDGYGVGATMTWYGLNGFYVDGQLQVSHYDSDLDSDLLGALTHDNGGSGEAVSVEVGKRIPVGGKLSITPQVQVIYSNVSFDRFVDPAGAVVSADQDDSLKARWGVSLNRESAWQNGRSHIYGIANLSYEGLDGTRALVSGTPIEDSDARLWGELGLGASVSWRHGLSLYGEVSGGSPFNGFGDSYVLKGDIGLRQQF
jgi:fibronectin-binding autotransporter adhesin